MVQWFGSYLDGRFIQTRVDGTLSNKLPKTAGVPQGRGTVLGLLLFLLYINNDLPDNIVSDTRLYAYDTSILYSHAPNHDITHSINIDLARIQEWSENDKIQWGKNKTYIYF